MAAFLGSGVPVFEIRAAGGAETDMLVRSPALGDALARTLGSEPMILLRGHGAAVVGLSVRQAVYRAFYAEKNAVLQSEAMKLGPVNYLNPIEARNAARTNDEQVDRPWQLWVSHLKQP